jgi:sporulation protein YlmC with PRC-barrel domain
MKSHRTTVAGFVSAIVVASALAAIAQQANQPNTDQKSATPPASTTDVNQKTDAAPSDADRTAPKSDLSKLDEKTSGATVRASQLLGTNIRNSQDQNVGEIKDLVVDAKSGKVRYVAVTYGGFLGVGSKLFAVPFEAFRVRRDTDTTLRTSDYVLTLDVTKEQLEGAQGFDNDRWPDFADTRMAQELERRYKVDRTQKR